MLLMQPRKDPTDKKMKNAIIFSALFLFVSYIYGQSKTGTFKTGPAPIEIKWVSNIKGDFSFNTKWSYSEGIYKNEFGQLSCHGFCPPESRGHV